MSLFFKTGKLYQNIEEECYLSHYTFRGFYETKLPNFFLCLKKDEFVFCIEEKTAENNDQYLCKIIYKNKIYCTKNLPKRSLNEI
jgi:hypothetical protein